MNKLNIALPFNHPQQHPMTRPHGLLRMLIVALCLTFSSTLVGAQTNVPELPPVAQEVLNKGILAAKIPDYPLALHFFEKARKLAPEAPVIYLNMGLAESKIPGRELRAMAWFGAYLTAYPEASNAAAVKEQITVLEVRNQSNVSRFLKTVQDAAGDLLVIYKSTGQSTSTSQVYLWLIDVTTWWLNFGDVQSAQKCANLIQDQDLKDIAQVRFVEYQAESGDIAGAQKTSDLIKVPRFKSRGLIAIAKAKIKGGDLADAKNTLESALKIVDLIETESEFRKNGIAIRTEWVQGEHRSLIAAAQAEAGDIAGAQKTTDLILAQHVYFKSGAQIAMAEAQMDARDLAGAEKTLSDAQKNAELIEDAKWKTNTQKGIAESRAKLDVAKGLSPNSQTISATPTPIHPVITVFDWLKKLDDDNTGNDCPLNTEPFLDLAGYLKSLPSNNSGSVYYRLHETAKKIIKAQTVITGMLKQEAMK